MSKGLIQYLKDKEILTQELLTEALLSGCDGSFNGMVFKVHALLCTAQHAFKMDEAKPGLCMFYAEGDPDGPGEFYKGESHQIWMRWCIETMWQLHLDSPNDLYDYVSVLSGVLTHIRNLETFYSDLGSGAVQLSRIPFYSPPW